MTEFGSGNAEGGKKELGSRNAEGGIKKRGAKSIAQSVQRGETKRITTEGHGATRKDTVYKFVVSVRSFILMDRIHSFDPPEADHSIFDN